MAPRFALINKDRDSTEQIARYLPANYYIAVETDDNHLVIAGSDNAGWTLNEYVIPRFNSGSIFPHEISPEDAVAFGFKPEEMVVSNEEALFWSNDGGWVDLASATRFGRHEVPGLHLPISGFSQWISMEEAEKLESRRQALEV